MVPCELGGNATAASEERWSVAPRGSGQTAHRSLDAFHRTKASFADTKGVGDPGIPDAKECVSTQELESKSNVQRCIGQARYSIQMPV